MSGIKGALENKRLIVLKGILFLLLAFGAGALLVALLPSWTVVVLLLITVWASCRFYFFCFHVITHYVDPEYRYDGICDALLRLARRREWLRGRGGDTSDPR